MNSVFDESLMKRKFEEGPMAAYVVVAPDLWATSSSTFTPPEATPNSPGSPAAAHNNNIFTFSATSSSTSATPKAGIPDFTYAMKKFKPSPPSEAGIPDFMKQFALSLSRTFALSALNSPEPPQAHNNNMFTFSYTPSSTSAAPKAGIPDFTYAMKKFKQSPTSRPSAPKSRIHDFDQSLMKRKFEEGPMAVYVVVAPDLWATSSSTSTPPEATPNSPGSPAPAHNNIFTFSATSSSTSATPKAGIPDFTYAMKKFKPSPPSEAGIPDFMKQFALSLSRTFALSALNSPEPPQAHNNNMFTFSYTPSSTSAAPKAGIPDFTYAMKKFKQSPPSRPSAPKSRIHDFDAKFNNLMTNLMEQFPLSPSGTFSFSAPSASAPAQVNDNKSTLKVTDDDKIVSRCIYDDLDPFYLSPEFVIPPHIKEFCELALEKYNNEKGTSYKYVCPELVLEDTKAHDTSHFFSFTASTSGSGDYYHSETFTANFKSGFRFSEGNKSYFQELEQVSRLADRDRMSS